MTNYKLTAITFSTWDEASDFVSDNYENWVWVEYRGIKQCNEMFPIYNQETFELIGVTVVFTKKYRKPVKEMTRIDCVNRINELGLDWIPRRSEGVITLQHDRTGNYFKGIKAKSWRGLMTIIKKLSHSYNVARIEYKEREWLKKYGII